MIINLHFSLKKKNREKRLKWLKEYFSLVRDFLTFQINGKARYVFKEKKMHAEICHNKTVLRKTTLR